MEKSDFQKDREAKKLESSVLKARHDNTLPDRTEEISQRIVPVTIKQKWDNFWYHYKMLFWGILVSAALVISFLVAVIFPERYDASLTAITTLPYLPIASDMETALNDIMPDYDENGEKQLMFTALQVPTPETENSMDPQMLMANQTKLVAMMTTGTQFLVLVDDQSYEHMKKNMEMIFVDLTTFVQDENIDGEKYKINGTNFCEKLALQDIESDLYLCLIDYNEYARPKKGADVTFANETDLLTKIIQFE